MLTHLPISPFAMSILPSTIDPAALEAICNSVEITRWTFSPPRSYNKSICAGCQQRRMGPGRDCFEFNFVHAPGVTLVVCETCILRTIASRRQ